MSLRLNSILFSSALLASTLLGAASPALAQYKVGIVNIERIVRESPVAVAAQKKLQAEFAPRERELQTLSERVKQAQEALTRNAPTLSESQRQTRERELGEMARDLQRRQQAFQEDVTQRRNEAISGLLEQANRVVRQMAQAEKFDVIFQEAVYWSPAVDMTDRVMKMLAESPAQK